MSEQILDFEIMELRRKLFGSPEAPYAKEGIEKAMDQLEKNFDLTVIRRNKTSENEEKSSVDSKEDISYTDYVNNYLDHVDEDDFDRKWSFDRMWFREKRAELKNNSDKNEAESTYYIPFITAQEALGIIITNEHSDLSMIDEFLSPLKEPLRLLEDQQAQFVNLILTGSVIGEFQPPTFRFKEIPHESHVPKILRISILHAGEPFPDTNLMDRMRQQLFERYDEWPFPFASLQKKDLILLMAVYECGQEMYSDDQIIPENDRKGFFKKVYEKLNRWGQKWGKRRWSKSQEKGAMERVRKIGKTDLPSGDGKDPFETVARSIGSIFGNSHMGAKFYGPYDK